MAGVLLIAVTGTSTIQHYAKKFQVVSIRNCFVIKEKARVYVASDRSYIMKPCLAAFFDEMSLWVCGIWRGGDVCIDVARNTLSDALSAQW